MFHELTDGGGEIQKIGQIQKADAGESHIHKEAYSGDKTAKAGSESSITLAQNEQEIQTTVGSGPRILADRQGTVTTTQAKQDLAVVANNYYGDLAQAYIKAGLGQDHPAVKAARMMDAGMRNVG